MKTATKLLIAVGAASIASMAAYEVIKKKSKEYYQNYFKGGSERLDTNTWLTNQEFETMFIHNREGLKLAGYYIPKEEAKFTMIIIHGYHSQGRNMNKYAQAFYENLPCDLFLPDLRSHGQSQGNQVGWGIEDKEDIKLWVNELVKKHPDRPIVLWGESMGGATVNFLASETMPNVKALVEDCGFSDLYEEFNFVSKNSLHVPFFPFYPIIDKEVKNEHSYCIKEARCIENVKKAKYPMMFIHGLADEIVPSYMVYDLFNACPTEKQLFVVEGAKHTQSIDLEKDNYIHVLREFLEEHVY